jgi:peptidoglycan/xylan/chitin deacetylase (PgdA/CDA1 family)
VIPPDSRHQLEHQSTISLPVLLYHHVGPQRRGTYPELTVTPQCFERQMSWLARRGYVGIRPSDWLAFRRGSATLPGKPVLITFDDAYVEVAELALPVLARHGFGAAVYVVTGQVGGSNAWDHEQYPQSLGLMSAGQIRYWADRGIEFGAHSRSHPDLTTLTPDRLAEEVQGSADDLGRILGNRPASFAYPFGFHDQRVRDCAARTFSLAMSCEEGLNTLATDPYLMRRAAVTPASTMLDFAWRVRLGEGAIQHLRRCLRLRSRAVAAAHWLRKPAA